MLPEALAKVKNKIKTLKVITDRGGEDYVPQTLGRCRI